MALVNLTCGYCAVSFWRHSYDVKPIAGTKRFCSATCREAWKRRGPTMYEAVCSGCGTKFQRESSVRGRRLRPYCSLACYRKYVDFAALGRVGGAAGGWLSLSEEFKRARSRLGGLARAANCSPEKLREIALAGAEARRGKRRLVVEARVSRRAGSVVVLGVRMGRSS